MNPVSLLPHLVYQYAVTRSIRRNYINLQKLYLYAESPVNLQLISEALALSMGPSAACLEFYFVLFVASAELQISSNPKKLRSQTDFRITVLSYTLSS